MRPRRLVCGVVLTVLVLGAVAVGGLVARAALTPPATPLDAGREYFFTRGAAGSPDRAAYNAARILASREVGAGRRLILYAWPSSVTTPANALSVAPLGIAYRDVSLFPWGPRSGWHAAGTAGRWAALPRGDELYVGSLPAGFCGVDAPLATAWGLSARASRARITWSDGAVTAAPFVAGAFLVARPDTNYPRQLALRLSVVHVAALDDAGMVLAEQAIPRSVVPEVRGPGQTGEPAVR